MPSMLPILTYDVPAQDEGCLPSKTVDSTVTLKSSDDYLNSYVEKKETESPGKIAGIKAEISTKEVKKSGKKKRRPAGKTSRKSEPNEKAEEVLRKFSANAKAGQAVKKAVLEIQLSLLDGVKEMSQLQGAMPLLTQSEYSDVVTERSIDKHCGYPLCLNELVADQTRKGRYRISLQEHKVYDLRETSLFCSGKCLVASKTFQSSLQIDREEIMGKEKLTAVIRSVTEPAASKLHHNSEESKDHDDHGIQSNYSLVSEVLEHAEFTCSSNEYSEPFDAVEGYVPRNSPRHVLSDNNAQVSVETVRDQVVLQAGLERVAGGEDPAGSSLGSSKKDKLPFIFDEVNQVEISPVPPIKSALKKGISVSTYKRSVSWKDQVKKDRAAERKDESQSLSPRLNELLELSNLTQDQLKKERTSKKKDQKLSPRHRERAKGHGSAVSGTTSVVTSTVDGESNGVISLTDTQTHSSNVATTVSVIAECNEEIPLTDSETQSSNGATSKAVDDEGNEVIPCTEFETQSSNVIPSNIQDGEANGVIPSASGSEISERYLAGKAVAMALMEASDAAVGGEVGSEEAASRAGISIVSGTESVEGSLPVMPTDVKRDDLNKDSASGPIDVRWPLQDPLRESPEEDDLDFCTAEGSWFDKPPSKFKIEVSTFGTIWGALEEWISAATIAHLCGKDSKDEEEYVVANGREYRMQEVGEDGTSAQISNTFSNWISLVFPDVVQALRLKVPVSTLQSTVGHLVGTMTFVAPLPAFGLNDWQMVLILLLDGLSVHRLPVVGEHLAKNMPLLCKVLDSIGTRAVEYNAFRGLVRPFDSMPAFSATSEA